jgi:hypothetical protein
MAHRRHAEEQELPFVALMDTMTNVVGVLLIVLVTIGISIASAARKIFSELPDVTQAQLEEVQQQLATLSPVQIDPAQAKLDELDAKKKIVEVSKQLETVDLSSVKQRIKLMDASDVQKQIDTNTKVRDSQRELLNKLLEEVERLKALLDETPIFKPEPPTYVRLPNPRDYPAEAVETRVIVTGGKIYFYKQDDYLPPLVAGLDKSRSSFRYQSVDISPFRPMLEKALGSPAEAQKAWPVISPLAEKFQMDQVALAYKALAADQLEANTKFLADIANISLVVRKPMPDVANAVVAAAKGDVTKWVALDPSTDPTKKTIKVESKGKDLVFRYGSQAADVKNTPRGIVDYVKTLADSEPFKTAGDNKAPVYDAYRIVEALQRATGSQLFAKTFSMEPLVKAGQTSVQVVMRPRPEGGETVEQISDSRSVFLSTMRSIKANPKGVALFQVAKDGFATYLEARKVADEVGVPAGWEFYNAPPTGIEIAVNIPNFEVQRFAMAPPPGPPPNPNAVTIKPPPKGTD